MTTPYGTVVPDFIEMNREKSDKLLPRLRYNFSKLFGSLSRPIQSSFTVANQSQLVNSIYVLCVDGRYVARNCPAWKFGLITDCHLKQSISAWCEQHSPN